MTNTPETWAAFINQKTLDSVPAIMAVGHLFIAARSALSPAEFLRLFSDALIPKYSPRKADELIAIAKNPILAHPPNAAKLPASYAILAKLNLIKPAILQEAIRDGKVTPTLALKAVQQWRREIGDIQQRPYKRRQGHGSSSELRTLAAPVSSNPRRITKLQRQERNDAIRQMAIDGWRSDQIGPAVNLTPEATRIVMKKLGIVCMADKISGHKKKLDANRILEHIVLAAEDIGDSERLIVFAELELHHFERAITSLLASHRAIGHLIGRLKQEKERQIYGTEKTHTPHIEGTSGSDQSDDRTASVREPASVHSVTR